MNHLERVDLVKIHSPCFGISAWTGERPYAHKDNLFLSRPNVQQGQHSYASNENPRLSLNKFFFFVNLRATRAKYANDARTICDQTTNKRVYIYINKSFTRCHYFCNTNVKKNCDQISIKLDFEYSNRLCNVS